MERNEGYTRAVNAGARHADGELIVLLNDDCVCDPGFVERITAPIDPAAGVVMAAGVMRDWHDPSLIDSAGMELDRTLLVFDYLNGEPLSRLQTGVPDPIGPSAAAAAFDRSTFLSVGGFDERLFAYWEDVDLVVRLRRLGLRCALAADAIGDHEHSATLGSGSARKNYLMGYGRGYVLRKWQVLNARRLGPVLVREAVLCAGQAIFDRNVAGVRGRLRGYRAAVEPERYPDGIGLDHATGAAETLRRRARRRSRLRSRPAARGLRTLAVFHLAGTSGPSRSLEAELAWLGEEGTLDVVIPGPGQVGEVLGDAGGVIQLDYEALTKPDPGARGLLRELRRLSHDVRVFRRVIRERRPGLVISVTTMLPAVPIAAWLERVPALVYCGELFDRGFRGGAFRALASRALAVLTARLSAVIVACSDTVAGQFINASAKVETVYPPVGERYSHGDGARLRERFGIDAGAPVLASVGNLTEGRGQDLLVRAMPSILERLPDARYLLAGDPFPRPQDIAYRERLVALVARARPGRLGDRRRPRRGDRRRVRRGRRGRQPGPLQRAVRPRPVRGRGGRAAGGRDPGRRDPRAAARRCLGADRRPRGPGRARRRRGPGPERAGARRAAGGRGARGGRHAAHPGPQPRRLQARGHRDARGLRRHAALTRRASR